MYKHSRQDSPAKLWWSVLLSSFVILIMGTTLLACASAPSEYTGTLSADTEDYVVERTSIGKIDIRVISYEPIANEFVNTVINENITDHVEIGKLFASFPIVTDYDKRSAKRKGKSLDYEDLGRTVQSIAELYRDNPARINSLNEYLKGDEVKALLDRQFREIGTWFPDQQFDIDLIINPLYLRGGTGSSDMSGSVPRGYLEMGTGLVLTYGGFNNIEDILFVVSHELTHSVNSILDTFDYDSIDQDHMPTFDYTVVHEGLATYFSGYFTDNLGDDYTKLVGPEYTGAELYEKEYVQMLAKKFLEGPSKTTLTDKIMYQGWFAGSQSTNVEARPDPKYPMLGYFLGFHVIKQMLATNDFLVVVENPTGTMGDILSVQLPSLMPYARQALQEIVEGI